MKGRGNIRGQTGTRHAARQSPTCAYLSACGCEDTCLSEDKCVCMKRDSRTALLTHLGFCKSHLSLSDHTHTNQADQSQLLWSALLQRSYITREVLGEG